MDGGPRVAMRARRWGRGLLRLGPRGGAAVRLHGSVVVALPMFAWLAQARMRGPVLVAGVAGAPLLGAWAWGGALAAALLLSLCLHELAHLAAARLLGGRLRDPTVMLLGGCGELDGVPGASSRVAVALAGPAASLAGAVICRACSARLGAVHVDLGYALSLLGQAQVTLALLDLLPALPLDGGRVVLALLSPRLGEARAARVMAWVGWSLAAVAALVGVAWTSVVPVALAGVLWAGADTVRGQLLGMPGADGGAAGERRNAGITSGSGYYPLRGHPEAL